MSTKPTGNEFEAIALDALKNVAGGAARASSSDSEVTAALSSITNSIKDLAAKQFAGKLDIIALSETPPKTEDLWQSV